jgi:uncharacterized membrane protein YdbT with pleckstrin-like domain
VPQHQFTIKPNLLNAAGPKFLKYLLAYSLASTTIYYALQTIQPTFLAYTQTRLITTLTLLTIVISIIVVKRRIIKLHYTKYDFYDTHVVETTGIIGRKRNSIPYKQISKLTNNTNLWDRITNASDITLKSQKHDDSHDLTLKSIKNADEIEHKIYKLLKLDPKEKKKDE